MRTNNIINYNSPVAQNIVKILNEKVTKTEKNSSISWIQ